MKFIAPLMIEHRLIMRMVKLLAREDERIASRGEADARFLEDAVDFMRTYADRTHHGKEEDIFFKKLAEKPLSEEHKRIMEELLSEHVSARAKVRGLSEATMRYSAGGEDALGEITSFLDALVVLYPAHIEKEDKHFFIPALDYFSAAEQDALFAAFSGFDAGMIHAKYGKLVEDFE